MGATEILTTVKENIVASLAAVAVAAGTVAALITSVVIGGVNKHRTGKFSLVAKKEIVQSIDSASSKK